MVRPLILVLVLSAGAASAQVPPRYYWETQTCSAGTCDRGAPAASDFVGTASALAVGMNLSGARGFYVSVCAASGQTLGGAGTLAAYVYEPWTGLVFRDSALDLKLSDVTSATACAGSPCRCATFPDLLPALRLNRRVLYAATGVTVSGGSTLSVYINAELSL